MPSALLASLAVCDLALPLELGVLHIIPFALLVGLLCKRRYPGEAVLERIRATRAGGAARRRPVLRAPRPALPVKVFARGGRLIADALAVRPPPVSPNAR